MTEGPRDVNAVYEILYNPSYTPRTSPRARIENLAVDGKPTCLLMKEPEAEYYEVDDVTKTIWGLMDGTRTMKQIHEEARRSFDSLTEKEVKDVVVSLAEEGTIEGTESSAKLGRVELYSALQVNVKLIRDSSQSLGWLFNITRRLMRRVEVPIALLISAVGFIFFYGDFVQIFSNPSLFDFAGSAILGLVFYQIVVLLPVYAVHEFAHAAACDYYGGKPREIGTGMYYLAPFFYCDVSDSWRLSRRARIMISAAGPLSTVVISSLFVFWSYLLPLGGLQTTLKISAFFGYYGTLTNFSPVIETDGYYILADVLNIPNLRDEAFGFAKRAILSVLRRPVKAVRMSSRHRRIVAVYAVVAFGWLGFFAYSTFWLMSIYGRDVYRSLSSLATMAVGTRAFSPPEIGENVVVLGYFGLVVTGYVAMAMVASRKIRMRGVKLETIHDKRVSAFLPLPSSAQRSRSADLAARAKHVAKRFTRFSNVTVEPPICVAALRLGKVDQSLDTMKGDMHRIEQSFRSLHRDYVSKYRVSEEPSTKDMVSYLYMLADQFPRYQTKMARASVSEFLARQDQAVKYLLLAAFGTVWTVEIAPSDYKRLRREMFPTLIAEDLGESDLPGELDAFKRHVIIGSDAIASLSSEIEKESKGVYRSPEVFQVTAFLEPVKGSLIFVGRTDKVQGSTLWLGGMYLYQAWISYMRGVLDDGTLGLKSIWFAGGSPTRSKVAKFSDDELRLIKTDLEHMETLVNTARKAMTRARSTYETASNFHEMMDSLLGGESFDVGLYRPILASNERHLEGVKERLDGFEEELERISKRFASFYGVVFEEYSKRISDVEPVKSWWGRLGEWITPTKWFGGPSKTRNVDFDAQVQMMYAAYRLMYGVVVGSDIIL